MSPDIIAGLTALGSGVVVAVVAKLSNLLNAKQVKLTMDEVKKMIDEILVRLAAQDTTIAQIHYEVKTNGGKVTLKDVVNNIRGDIHKINATQTARLQIQLNEISDAVYICDSDGYCTFANKTCCELWGMAPELMKGLGWIRAVGKNQSERQEISTNWKYSVSSRPYIPFNREHIITNQITKKVVEVYSYADEIKDDDGQRLFFYWKVKVKSAA